jgi:hypothetical protein
VHTPSNVWIRQVGTLCASSIIQRYAIILS